ncbi:MAG: NAD(+)/NADH kinase [Leucobacter sp.]
MSPAQPLRIGLIVNPVSGIGGPAGLGGSDGAAAQAEALARGSVPRSGSRAERLLRALTRQGVTAEILTARGAMGEDAVRAAGWEPALVLPIPEAGRPTTAADTSRIAAELRPRVDVIVFAGGDGTARDVLAGTDEEVILLGVPAGVKMHSGVFARSPEAAAGIIAASGGASVSHPVEIVDIDEEARRNGRLNSRIYGRARVLGRRGSTQGGKIGSTAETGEQLGGIAAEVDERIDPEAVVLFGPGTTVRRVSEAMGFESTLLGVDAVIDGELVGSDCSAEELARLTEGRRVQLVVSPVGGQGFLLGRGNQQIDERVLARVDADDLLIVCTSAKLGDLAGGPFWIDAQDPSLIERFAGPRRVIVGRHHEAVVRVSIA